MKEIRMSYGQISEDYPELIDQILKEISSHNKMKIEDLEFFYYWTLMPSEDKMEEYKHMLLFNERLNYELDKLAIEVYIKGGTYIRGEVVDKLPKPKAIIEDLSRLLVSSMRYEQLVFQNENVLKSIPSNIEPFIEIQKVLFPKMLIAPETPEVYSLDEILEKISKFGMEILTTKEKELLDKFSKE